LCRPPAEGENTVTADPVLRQQLCARLLGALDTIDKAANLLNEGTYDHDRTECVCSPCLALRVLRHG
jgi:hypothetical protein